LTTGRPGCRPRRRQAAARGPQGGADAKLSRASHGARELEIGEIRAGNEQDKSRQPEQKHGNHQSISVLHERLEQNGTQAVLAPGLGPQGRKAGRESGQSSVELIERVAGTVTADQVQIVVVAIRLLGFSERERTEHVARPPQKHRRKGGRHNADDGCGLAIDADVSPDHARIAAELRLPGRMAENGDVVANLILFLGKDPAQFRLHPEDGKELR
jgi:hypothetical protein